MLRRIESLEIRGGDESSNEDTSPFWFDSGDVGLLSPSLSLDFSLAPARLILRSRCLSASDGLFSRSWIIISLSLSSKDMELLPIPLMSDLEWEGGPGGEGSERFPLFPRSKAPVNLSADSERLFENCVSDWGNG